jgi:hypothetical protein
MTVGFHEVCVNRLNNLGEKAQKVSVQELKLPKPEEPKRFTIVDLRETHVDRSLTLGENTLGDSRCAGVEPPKARIVEVNHIR